MPGDKPGDAKSSPFGDGSGGAGMAGGKGQPESYGQDRPQQAGSDPVNPNEIPEGGKDLVANPPAQRGATGIGGDGRKPFKLGG